MTIADDINRIVKPKAIPPKLSTAVAPVSIQQKTGLERRQSGDVEGELVTVKSTDGIFTFTVRVVRA